MRKSVMIFAVLVLALSVAGCSGSGNKAVTAFMDRVKSGDLDGAVSLIRNRFDRQVPVKVRAFFAGKTVQGYTLIEDKDPKAGAAASMGMAMVRVRIRFAAGEQTLKFLLKDDGGWVISNILLP